MDVGIGGATGGAVVEGDHVLAGHARVDSSVDFGVIVIVANHDLIASISGDRTVVERIVVIAALMIAVGHIAIQSDAGIVGAAHVVGHFAGVPDVVV